jgi:kumamolisin
VALGKQYVPLPGSERQQLPGAVRVGPADPDERIEVSLYLRSLSPPAPRPRHTLSRSDFAAKHGARSGDLAAVEAFAYDNGLQVADSDPARRRVVLAGTVAAMSRAFDVELHRYEAAGAAYRGRTGHVRVPAELAGIVEAVLGLDDRPQARPHFVNRETLTGLPAAAPRSFTPREIAGLYDFPVTAGDGSGQCIGIIEFGGGYRDAEVAAYFASLGLDGPAVTSVSVDNAVNAPVGDPNSADGEVLLDIEVAGAVAPGARIVVYFAPNTDRGWADAVTAATFDTVNRPSVLSISWGSAEINWTHQAIQAIDQAFQAAAAVGVTVCCASGDDGSRDRVDDGRAHVDFPASSPHVLGCGGTRLLEARGAIDSETTWNDASGATGGGISDVFALPGFQAASGVPASVNPGGRTGRGVPDVAGDADLTTGYQVLVDGQNLVFGGTSAVAPLWAGLLALLNEQLAEPVGYLNPLLYEQIVNEADATGDVTGGGNGAYQAGSGWDACTGLGTPRGENLLAALIY